MGLVKIAASDALDTRRACDVTLCDRSEPCSLAPCRLAATRAQGTPEEWFRACRRECVEQLGEHLQRLWREQDRNQLRIDLSGGAS